MFPKKIDLQKTVKILVPYGSEINNIINELNKIKNAQTDGISWLYSDDKLKISLASGSAGSGSLPKGTYGSLLWHDGSSWNPLYPPAQTTGTTSTVLTYNGAPTWGTASLGASTSHPFRLSGFASGSKYYYTLELGTVNNAIPLIGTSSLVASPTPYGEINNSGSGQIFLHVTTDNAGVLTFVSASATSSMSTIMDSGSNRFRSVGIYVASGSTITFTNTVRTNQTLFLCNNQSVWGAS